MSTPRSPLNIPLSKWQRSKQESRDAAPTPLILEITPTTFHEDTTDVSEEEPTDQSITLSTPALAPAPALASRAGTTACAVCCQHQYRYNCPRCQLPYCSVECYRTHTSTTAKMNDGGTNPSSSNSSPCTEEFYQNRVTEILRLEVVEQRDTTRQILNRHYQHQQQQQQQNDNHYSDNLNGESHNPLEELSEEELFEVLLALDQQEQQYPIGSSVEQDCTVNDLQNLLSPSLRAAFERALQQGEVSKLVVQSWSPWWRPEFSTANEKNGHYAQDEEEEEEEENIRRKDASVLTSGSGKNLDERLLRVPPFGTLRKGPAANSQILLYKLVELIYGIAWMLRLYNGPINALDLPVDATMTLIAASTVLGGGVGKDGDGSGSLLSKYTTLEQVLSDCTARSTRLYPSNGCNTNWTILTEDVSLLVASHRTIGRSLLDAIGIVKAAIAMLKNPTQPPANTGSNDNGKIKAQISQLRRIRKKLEFYLSFSQQEQQHNMDIGIGPLGSTVRAWIERWKVSDPGNEDAWEELHELVLPSSSSSS
jgi:hypothetical protein